MWVTEKGDSCDPFTQDDAGGTPAAKSKPTLSKNSVKPHFYEDDDGGIWDGEDHTWAYRPTKRTDVEESENFDAELSIQFDPENDEVFDVSCSIAEDFSVTVLPTPYELK